MSDYEFTKDWFHWAPQVWEQLIPMLPERNPETGRGFIEIGSFEGRSAVWIAENMMQPGDYLTCIDTWQGGEEHTSDDIDGAEALFDHNMKVVQDKFPDLHISKVQGSSYYRLAEEIASNGTEDYDFIYIDGSHIAKDVLTDACMAWALLKKGGIMVFDDYMWGNPRDILHRPKPAIDAFINLFAEEVDVIHLGYQAVVRKK